MLAHKAKTQAHHQKNNKKSYAEQSPGSFTIEALGLNTFYCETENLAENKQKRGVSSPFFATTVMCGSGTRDFSLLMVNQ
ncbi:hypothetical protein [Undibacterium curvum]|uniref:hypothetical protein n=1 Tax=Undibacterium curvum TaxID=2762294 RepID=UPI003D1473E0